MAAKTSTTAHEPRTSPRTSSKGARFAAIAFTGLGVAVIAACAVLLSYNGIYQIARQGNVDPRYAHMYPGGFTLLLLMAFWISFLLRDAPRVRRLGVDAIILALILLAAFASALEPLGYTLIPKWAVVVTAVAPWVALLIAFRIWLWMVSHLRGERAGAPRRPRAADRPETADTAPLPAEPAPRPADSATPPEGTPTQTTEPTASPERGPASSGPALLWPRAEKRRSAPESGVRVLEGEDAETRSEANNRTEAPEARTSAAAPESTAPAESIIPFSRSAPETEAAPEPGTEAEAETTGSAAPESATDSGPTTRASETTDNVPASETDPAASPAPAPADSAASNESQPSADSDSPTLGQLLRRALLPPGEQDPVGAAPEQAEAEPDPPFQGDLPKRTPQPARSPIREAAEAPEPVDPPAAAGSLAGQEGTADNEDDGRFFGAAEDGFIHELPAGDPTSDEADPRGEWAPDPASEPGAGTDTANRLGKRPVALRPRRSPMQGFSADPPSGRVRSEPTPPEEPRE
ncbi:hypothetical protein F4561_004948 [Lipingzhangella halophila]|uniref:DUF2637 domain-containing protein n=1 Tax=Lipingzhangella halophila TaxID=1783352 RepID=A0A7W7RLD0_9ACTN|nr:hypothetical protein [Lipingzhangella halophila]MBB4934128.1 hypothetical protein [Lipingzhangella halophila]